MSDLIKNVPRLRYEKINKLIELINDRELATSESEYDSGTALINEMQGLIKCPVQKTFLARIERLRQPWVRIIEQLLAEISRGEFCYPFKFDQEGSNDVLFLRTSDVMEQLERGTWMHEHRKDMPIRSDRVLKKQLKQAGVLLTDRAGNAKPFERTLGGKRIGHLVALRLADLRLAGLNTVAASQAATTTLKP